MKERKGMAPFMKNVVFFALFANLFILVSADSRCADNSLSHSRQYKCTENYVCCADGECHPKTCFNIFSRQDKDCTNQRDKLICCGNRCVFGSNFAGWSCSLDSDCSVNQVYCRSKCVRRRCNFTSDCSSGQSCCSGNCREGLTCIGKSCRSKKNCQAAEICCRGTFSKVIAYFVGSIAAFLVIVLIIAIFLVYRRRRATRRRPVSRDITSNITAPTHNAGITINILEEDYPLYQLQRPTFDQHFESNTESEQLLPCDLIPTH